MNYVSLNTSDPALTVRCKKLHIIVFYYLEKKHIKSFYKCQPTVLSADAVEKTYSKRQCIGDIMKSSLKIKQRLFSYAHKVLSFSLLRQLNL